MLLLLPALLLLNWHDLVYTFCHVYRGISLTVLSYIVCLMFIRIKMPNYMR